MAISKKMCGNNNGIGGHQKINIYYPKTIYIENLENRKTKNKTTNKQIVNKKV